MQDFIDEMGFVCEKCGKTGFDCECPMPCPKCGGPLEINEYKGYPGEYFEIMTCKVCGFKEEEYHTPDSKCDICGEPRPIIDADFSGPVYGQCRQCHGLIADVWNPKPDVFYG